MMTQFNVYEKYYVTSLFEVHIRIITRQNFYHNLEIFLPVLSLCSVMTNNVNLSI